MNGAPQQHGSHGRFSYPPPQAAPPRPVPLLRRGWFVVLTAIVVVGILGAVLGTVLREVIPTPQAPTLSGLDDIGAIQPGLGDPSPPTVGTIGVPARDGDLEFTVSGVECGIDRIGTETFGTDAVGQFCIVTLDVQNVGAAPATMIDFVQDLYDDAGQAHSASIGGSIYLSETVPAVGPLEPGERRPSRLVYDLPDGAVPAEIELHGAPFGSPGVRVPLR